MTGVPWEELADAHEQLADAQRFGEPDDVARAAEYLGHCKDECALIGTLLVTLALDHGSLMLQKKLAEVFGQLAASAWEEARRARKAARLAVEEVAILRDRLRAVERRVDSLTPGVGEPGRTI